jgi:hypothetical protein
MTQPRTLLYILGPSYSGSTLLTFLIARHPEVATVGELKAAVTGAVEENACSCGERWDLCPFWRQVEHEMRARGATFSLGKFGTHFGQGTSIFSRVVRLGVRPLPFDRFSDLALRFCPPLRRQLTAIVRQNHLLMEVVLGLQGGRVFLDGSKDPERLKQLRRAAAGPVKVVRLTRDGRGVTNSYMKYHHVPMRVAVREWLRLEQECDRIMASLRRAELLLVQYERLCATPDSLVGEIWHWAGLPPVGADAAQPGKLRPPEALHILGNPMRLGFRNSVKLDEKWKTELSQADLAVFDQIAGSLNRVRGYH